MLQQDLEEQFSRRSIRERVKQDIDMKSYVYLKCVDSIKKLLSGTYYASKQKRLEALTMAIEDITLELFIAVLPIKQISPIQAVAAQLGNRLGYENPIDAVKTASEIIAVCEISGLYTIYHSMDKENDTGTLGIRPNFALDPKVERFIEQTMYLPPMLCNPVEWESNTHGGHLHGSGSIILGAINHHDLPQALDAVNIIQGIEWELNRHILELEESPNKPLDTDDKVEQFKVMATQSREVYNLLLNTGNKFHFVWKYDKRGRMNCMGYHVNLQSTQYKKAILQFKNKEVVTCQ